MFKLKSDGYVYISDKGIEYELLEGVSVGTGIKYTSDIMFVMLNNCEYNVDNCVVDYVFGTRQFVENPKKYEETIKKMVDKYEDENFGLEKIINMLEEKMECGYAPQQLEVDFGMLDDTEGYYISKINGWGSTPITPILAVEGSFKDKELIKQLDDLNIAHCL